MMSLRLQPATVVKLLHCCAAVVASDVLRTCPSVIWEVWVPNGKTRGSSDNACTVTNRYTDGARLAIVAALPAVAMTAVNLALEHRMLQRDDDTQKRLDVGISRVLGAR